MNSQNEDAQYLELDAETQKLIEEAEKIVGNKASKYEEYNQLWLDAEKQIFDAEVTKQKLEPIFTALGVEPPHYKPEVIAPVGTTPEVSSQYEESTRPNPDTTEPYKPMSR